MPRTRASSTLRPPRLGGALRRVQEAFEGFCLVALLALPAAADVAPTRATELEHMVLQDCGSCHGLTRKGGLGLPLTADALAHADREGLALIILDGVPGTAMPPWRPLLTEAEALWIADYLKGDSP